MGPSPKQRAPARVGWPGPGLCFATEHMGFQASPRAAPPELWLDTRTPGFTTTDSKTASLWPRPGPCATCKGRPGGVAGGAAQALAPPAPPAPLAPHMRSHTSGPGHAGLSARLLQLNMLSAEYSIRAAHRTAPGQEAAGPRFPREGFHLLAVHAPPHPPLGDMQPSP